MDAACARLSASVPGAQVTGHAAELTHRDVVAGLLDAVLADGAYVGVIEGTEEHRASRAVLIAMVARWSAR
jgi:hypothetical protein